MAESRVIQDSDESDAELSDAGSSIDPLQHQGPPADVDSHTEQSANEGQAHVVEKTRQDVVDGIGISTESNEPVVNFDSFLATQSQDATIATASQRAREEMWIGGGVVDTVGELCMDVAGGVYTGLD